MLNAAGSHGRQAHSIISAPLQRFCYFDLALGNYGALLIPISIRLAVAMLIDQESCRWLSLQPVAAWMTWCSLTRVNDPGT